MTLPLMNRPIPVMFDEIADPQFGTGVVKVTPAHDPNDLEAGKRHDLAQIKVIGEDARMTARRARTPAWTASKPASASLPIWKHKGCSKKSSRIRSRSASAIAAERWWSR